MLIIDIKTWKCFFQQIRIQNVQFLDIEYAVFASINGWYTYVQNCSLLSNFFSIFNCIYLSLNFLFKIDSIRFDLTFCFCLGILHRKTVNLSMLVFLHGTPVQVRYHLVPQSHRRIRLSLFSAPILARSNGAQLGWPVASLSMCQLSKFTRSRVIGYGFSNWRMSLVNNRTRNWKTINPDDHSEKLILPYLCVINIF
jgi:hypothetical protein